MKLMCLAILLLGLSCLVESQRPTGRPGRPNPQEMCANTMEFFMDLGWAGPTDDAPCPDDAKALWKFMLERWDADGNGCLSAGLESDIPVRLPAILFNQSRAQSSDKTEGKQDGANRSNMAVTAMVPVTTVNGSSGTSAASSALKTVVKPFGTRTPLISKLLSESSGLASIRDRLQTDGVSEEVIDLMLNSRRQGTTKSYESAWKNWRLWCDRNGVDPTRCSVNDLSI